MNVPAGAGPSHRGRRRGRQATRVSSPAVKRLAAIAALVLVSLAISLVAGEFAVRWIFRDLTTTTPIESWFGERWKVAHLQRTKGFRERPFSWKKPPGERRLVVIGDSYTVAMGLPDEDRYARRIESALGGDVRVLQLARPGQELDGHVATLRDDALRAGADFVLLQFFVNDFEISKLGRPRPSRLVGVSWLHAFLYRHSALYAVAALQWNALQASTGMVEDYGSYLQRRYGDPNGESRIAVELLREFFEIAQVHEIPVGVVLFPVFSDSDDAFGFLYDRVLAECERAEVPCVDLRPVFASHAGDEDLRLNRFDPHAGSRAHELAAEVLLETFGGQWRRRGLGRPD